MRKKVAIGKFNPEEGSAVVVQTQAMHVSMKSFIETNFASYLHLGELDLAGLRQLCYYPDPEENPLESSSQNVGPSSNPLSNRFLHFLLV